MSLALMARMASRKCDEAMAIYHRYRASFAELSFLVPEIVEQDLILAELWLNRWEFHEDH
jgi:hypothetical protein